LSAIYRTIKDCDKNPDNYYYYYYYLIVFLVSQLAFILQLKPGLSSYAQDPKKAAESLVPLLDKAETVVPRELRSSTPVRVGVGVFFFFFFVF